MKKVILFSIILLIFPMVYAECIEPADSLIINEDTSFCEGEYNIAKEILIEGNDITLDCNNADIKCTGMNNGIKLSGNNINLKNCIIEDCTNAIYLKNSQDIIIDTVTLSGYQIGIASESSTYDKINVIMEGNANDEEAIETDEEDEIIEIEEPETAEDEETEVILEDVAEERPDEIIVEAVIITEDEAKEVIKESIIIKNQNLKDTKELTERIEFLYDKYFQNTKENLDIKRTVIRKKDQTTVKIELIPKKELINLEYYEIIPKCFISFLDEIVFATENYTVVKSDPIFMWKFDTLGKKKDIQYGADKDINMECINLMKGFGLSIEQDYKRSYNLYLIALLVVLTLTTIFYFKKKIGY